MGKIYHPRFSLEEIIVKYNSFDLLFLSSFYKNSQTKYETKCLKCDFYWETTPNNVLKGYGCPNCFKNKLSIDRRFSVDKVKEIFESKNLIFNSTEYVNAHIRYPAICKKCNHEWLVTFMHISTGTGCPSCANSSPVSKKEIKWLDELKIPPESRQKTIKINESRYVVDALITETNTIYEFFGDFWHGNPKKYKSEDINPRTKCSYGKLYEKTLDRINLFEKHGYKIIYTWESDLK